MLVLKLSRQYLNTFVCLLLFDVALGIQSILVAIVVLLYHYFGALTELSVLSVNYIVVVAAIGHGLSLGMDNILITVTVNCHDNRYHLISKHCDNQIITMRCVGIEMVKEAGHKGKLSFASLTISPLIKCSVDRPLPELWQ